MAELLVVIGIIALLLAVLLPPIQSARRQAMRTHCAGSLQQIGMALEHARLEFKFYPAPDDGGAPIRYTWFDVLLERRLLGNSAGAAGSFAHTGSSGQSALTSSARAGYCPADALPDALNAARHGNLLYPLNRNRSGLDYSYGIGVPLASGGWAWRPGTTPGDGRVRRFTEYDQHTSGRVLAGDAVASGLFNLSGRAFVTGIWNDETQFDNTVAWGRHIGPSGVLSANLLFQDGHAAAVSYNPQATLPVDTGRHFLWRMNEPLHTNPDDADDTGRVYYPNVLPPNFGSRPPGNVFPDEMLPAWYTANHHWTQISHK